MDYWRQLKWFSPTFERVSATIIGVGAIGSVVGVGLAKLGVQQISLVDFDKTEGHNFPNQWYAPQPQIYKVSAVASEIKRLNPEIEVNEVIGKAGEVELEEPDVLIITPDNYEARRDMINYYLSHNWKSYIIDGSTGGLLANVFSANLLHIKDYIEYIEGMKDVKDEGECTAVSIIFTGFGVASEIIRRVPPKFRVPLLHTFHNFETGEVYHLREKK